MKNFVYCVVGLMLLLPNLGFAQSNGFETQLFEGKLVGFSFELDTRTNKTHLKLQFLQSRGFALVALSTGDIPMLTSLASPASIDPSKLTPDTWQTQLETALPRGVHIGQDCLVTVEWKMSERKVLAIIPATNETRREFIHQHLDYLLRYHRYMVQSAIENYLKSRSAHEENVKRIELAHEVARKEDKKDDLGIFENQLKTARWNVIQNTGWCQRSLIGQQNALQFLKEEAPESHEAIDGLLRQIDEELAVLPPGEIEQSTNTIKPNPTTLP